MKTEEIAKYFDNGVEKYGDVTWQAASWNSPEMQRAVFNIVSRFADLNGKSVLDVGCGQGDYSQFLKMAGIECDYYGLDISTKMVESAEKRFPDESFVVCDLFDCVGEFDFVIAPGTFGLKTDKPKDYMEKAMEKMYSLAKGGIALTLLSTIGDEPKFNQMQYFNPPDALRIALKVTEKVAFNHVSIPGHMLITMFK